MPVKPHVTIFADASFFPRHRNGGWGAWFKGDGRDSVCRGGPLPGLYDNSSHAELAAILEALKLLVEVKYLTSDDFYLMVQSDSMFALSTILTAMPGDSRDNPYHSGKKVIPAPSVLPWAADTVCEIRRLVQSLKACIAVRHVPGHTRGEGRNWVNQQCDRLARRGARESEARILKGLSHASTHSSAK